jgi:hypothetical protein
LARGFVAAVAVVALVGVAATVAGDAGREASRVAGDGSTLAGTDGLDPYRGDLHSQTSFSDGTGTPELAFQQTKAAEWKDFFAVTDHSEWLAFPFQADTDCIGPQVVGCYSSPMPERTEWEETGFQAQRFTDESFLAVRGFEWSSPVEGHVNVYNTQVWTDSVQTGPAPMTGLYAWLEGQRLDEQAFATFNHPGREPLLFDEFAYEPRLDDEFASLEAFNRDDDYSDTYLKALDAGWHVGAVGVSDAHGAAARVDRSQAHTVALLDSFTKPGLTRAYVDQHTVATLGSDQDARLLVDGVLMGGTVPDPGAAVEIEAAVYDAGEHGATAIERIELLGPDGFQRDLALGPGEDCRRVDGRPNLVQCEATVALDGVGRTDLGERYLTLRAHQDLDGDGDAEPAVMTSAVWLDGTAEEQGPPP